MIFKDAYAVIAPDFAEVRCPVNPGSLTLRPPAFLAKPAIHKSLQARPLDSAGSAILGLASLRQGRHRGHVPRRADPALESRSPNSHRAC